MLISMQMLFLNVPYAQMKVTIMIGVNESIL